MWWHYQIQLLADLNLKKTPQLVELVDDSKVTKFYLYSFILDLTRVDNLYVHFVMLVDEHVS